MFVEKLKLFLNDNDFVVMSEVNSFLIYIDGEGVNYLFFYYKNFVELYFEDFESFEVLVLVVGVEVKGKVC